MLLILIIITLAIFLIAAYTDLRTLEVPDWLNYAGIAAGLGIHLLLSLSDWTIWPLLSSLIGLAIGFSIGALMYYSGQWGGGDAKLLMAAGALIGFEADKFALGTSFLINLVFIGALWGFVYSIGYAVINFKLFARTFLSLRHHLPYARIRLSALLSAGFLIITSFVLPAFRLELVLLACISYVLAYLILFIKSVELSCLHKWVTPDKLTPGDWLVHSIKIDSLHIKPNKLGLEQKEVAELRKLHAHKKIDTVLVRYGIPFTPAFLFSFACALFWGNIVLTFLFG